MDKELIINSSSSEVNIALLEEKLLVELHKEKTNTKFAVGDIYLGKVKKLLPGLNAAFVDVGYEKDAFLHYLDLGSQVNSLKKFTKISMSKSLKNISIEKFVLMKDIEKTGKITEILSTNSQILVQIAKEPISTKGPRISSEISLAGRYLILVPFSNKIFISQKIKNTDERNRLKRLIQSIKPNNFGVIIRTVAENKRVADLDIDLRNLIEKWNNLAKKLTDSIAPKRIISELDRTAVILRDMLNESFNSIIVDTPILYEETKNYLTTIAPHKSDIVKLYKGRAPIFEHYGIEKQIKNSFGRTVTIKSGVYLIIEHTEALHVIDVNSGHRVNKKYDQEMNALETNLEAAGEIARQLRLRDMGGIVVIDFVDMLEGKHRRELYQKIKDEMSKDRARHSILPPSKFGLVQITRQRVRPEMSMEIIEKCPTCNGSGEIKPSILLSDEIEGSIKYLLRDQNEKKISIAFHPFLYAYFTKGIFSIRMKWFFKYKKWISLQSMPSYDFVEYHIFNKNNDEIKL